MEWFYRAITFLPERCNNEVLVGKCLRVLHGFNYEYKTNSIGVSFPLWCEETIGSQLTFVSQERMQLDFLLRQKYFDDMARIGYFLISKTKVVPSDCGFVAYERNCGIDRSTVAGQAKQLRRLQARAEARGEFFDLKQYHLKCELRVEQQYHSIGDVSQKSFRLNLIRVTELNRVSTGCFSSYGLANSEDHYQAVPDI